MTRQEIYLRPVPLLGDHRRQRPLAGGPVGFAEIELMRGGATGRQGAEFLPADAIAALVEDGAERLARLSAPRPALAGLSLARPRIMGVLNVTPDSFSDGGRHDGTEAALAHALSLVEAGADILDIGGESTRPGAAPVPEQEELDRVIPVIERLAAAGCSAPISVDTRKATVARAALAAGADIVNDVSALTHDPGMAAVAAEAAGLCLMHAKGDPRTMQDAPSYEDVTREVYDFLSERIAAAEIAGIARERIVIDPGIGFGKTLAHNVALLSGLSLFHGLGCAVLVGVSRKRFIGKLSGMAEAARRAPGSIAAGLHALSQGAHILRVHDVAETVQAVRVWEALNRPGMTGDA